METFAGEHPGAGGLLTQGAAAPGGRRLDVAAAPSVIQFTVPGVAVPWARAGGGKSVVRFTPPKQRNFMATLVVYAEQAMRRAGIREPLAGPIELSVRAVYAWPASWSAKKRAAPGAKWKTSRPDGGNLQKILEDALNTVVWRDDAQVASWHGWKVYGDVPRLVVKISTLGEGSGGASTA